MTKRGKGIECGGTIIVEVSLFSFHEEIVLLQNLTMAPEDIEVVDFVFLSRRRIPSPATA